MEEWGSERTGTGNFFLKKKKNNQKTRDQNSDGEWDRDGEQDRTREEQEREDTGQKVRGKKRQIAGYSTAC